MGKSTGINQAAIDKLETANRTVNHFARLITLNNGKEDERLFEFLYNPESIKYAYSGKYNAAVTGSTSLPSQTFLNSEAQPIQFSQLILDTWSSGKSLRKVLDGLRALTIAEPGKLSPRSFYFVFGTERIGPCVLTDLSYEVSGWLGGEPAQARVDLSLLEIPDPDTAPKQSNVVSTSTVQALTQRQKEEASKKAEEYVRANLNKLPAELKKVIQSEAYKYLTTDNGTVSILDKNNNPIQQIGSWDGQTFTAN